MCLCIPSQVVEIHPEDSTVTVDTLGVKRRVSVHLILEPLALGDYLLIHVGFAISKIDQDEALKSLEEYRRLLAEVGEEGARELFI
ncbi:hydrogenase assembly protein HupF [Photobacterium jeanii]|uniref:Hydrogenase assembly protein HupF n=1 Tax=Photobacterium jeanii TaxID=858640 RepID=A0A178K1T9_9GAMM|nr:HypC/HybG/HupF family hydrogenase formation chaperone [Photobacterium jeanii]OAN11299.1 hydrogenase assembly protein HupF [Photobacterium jeanii]PST90819.1 HypC/HybG/HupF family hydrogenase formation chaperone [Photobacterium jeanii]